MLSSYIRAFVLALLNSPSRSAAAELLNVVTCDELVIKLPLSREASLCIVDPAEDLTVRANVLVGKKTNTAPVRTTTAKKLPKIPAATAAGEEDESGTAALAKACCDADAVVVEVDVAVIVCVLDELGIDEGEGEAVI